LNDIAPLTISILLLAKDDRFEVENGKWVTSPPPGYYCYPGEKVDMRTVRRLAHESLSTQCEDMMIQLTARCAGLLEVPNFAQGRPDSQVQYLHRTVREYLEKDDC
jgi:hypothetical protein